MTSNYHDTGYKELFSHPEFVQQLIEGFVPTEYEMVTPEPPEFLRPYQPHLRYYLVDECKFSGAELAVRGTALSGVFEIEQATSRQNLQIAVQRIVTLIEQDPHKERLDKVVTRWLKRHLAHLGAEVNLDNIHSLVESRGMLAENLQHWAEKERSEGMREGMQKGKREGELKAKRDTARNLIIRTDMDDQTVAEIAGLSVDVVAQLRVEIKH